MKLAINIFEGLEILHDDFRELPLRDYKFVHLPVMSKTNLSMDSEFTWQTTIKFMIKGWHSSDKLPIKNQIGKKSSQNAVSQKSSLLQSIKKIRG